MNNVEKIISLCDEIHQKLAEQRRYNRGTLMLTIVLWGLGLPLVFLGSLVYAAWH